MIHVKIFLTNLAWGILFSASWYTCLEVLKLNWTLTWIVNLTIGWIELELVYWWGRYVKSHSRDEQNSINT